MLKGDRKVAEEGWRWGKRWQKFRRMIMYRDSDGDFKGAPSIKTFLICILRAGDFISYASIKLQRHTPSSFIFDKVLL